jgi:hypothetical protein
MAIGRPRNTVNTVQRKMNATTQKLVSTIDPKMRASLTRKLTSLKKKHNSLSRVPPDIAADRMGMAPIPEAAFETDDIDAEAEAAPAEAAPVAALDIKYPVTIRKTLDQGDCFYSAIYRASKEREDLLNKLSNCLSLDPSDEALFVQSFRNRVANRIISNDGPIIYDNTKLRAETNSNTYVSIIENYPEWFREEFGNYGENIGDRDSFIQRLASHVREPGEWVGEIEVGIITEELKKCGILLEIRSNTETELYKTSQNMVVIHLYNPNEQHYEYFSFEAAPVVILKRIRKQTVKNLATSTEPVRNLEQEIVLENTDKNIRLNKPFIESQGCDKFYDPCSGIPLTEEEDPISFIQKKLTDIRRKKELTELKDLESDTLARGTRLDLLKWFLTKEFTSLEEINGTNLLEFKVGVNNFSRSLFESYWDILLALGYIPGYEVTPTRYMYNGKAESLSVIPDLDSVEHKDFIVNPYIYLNKRKIATSNAGGASDITLFYKSSITSIKKADPCSFDKNIEEINEKIDKPKFIFASSKKYKNEKSIDKYDILNIYGAAKQINPDKIDKKIILLVSNREAVEEVKRRTKSKKYISEEASDTFGQDDMMAYLRQLYINKHIELEKLEKNRVIDRPYKLSLQLHQIMTVSVISTGIKKYYEKRGPNNRFLVGILPRGGKTYIAGGIISKLDPKNVVILLGAKSETQSQFIDELFLKFQDFYDYTVVNVKDENDPTLTNGNLDPSKKHIFVMSIELFKAEDTSLERRPLLKLLRGLIPDKPSPVDLIISDEAHLKQTTHKAEKAVKGATTTLQKVIDEEVSTEDEIDTTLAIIKNIPVVYLTGTYRKPRYAFKIPDENIVIWDYQDVQRAKVLDENMEYFTNSFGEVFKKALDYMILTGKTVAQIKEDYSSFPEIHLLETHFNKEIEEQLLLQGDQKGIPDMAQLFIINTAHNFNDPSNWHNGFKFNTQMKRLIDFIGTDKMTSIDRICQRTGDRLRFVTSEFKTHSQLWFLPKMSGNPLSKRIMALTGTIFQDPWFRKHFHVLAVTGTNWTNELRSISHIRKTVPVGVGEEKGTFRYYLSDSSKSLKESILEFEEEARVQNKGLIILAQNMLQLGISLPCVNIVALLDSGSDVDERIQKMYRALTQAPQKRDAFVIDMNYFRTITAITEYQVQAFNVRKKRSPGTEDKKEIINSIFDIYSINDDIVLFETNEKRREAIEEIYSKQATREYKLPTDLVDAGKKINMNIDDVIDVNISHFDDLELHSEANKKREKELIRKIATELKKAKAINREELFPGVSEEEFANKPQSEIDNAISKKLAYLDIFKILLRYGAIATDYPTVANLKSDIAENDDLQQEIYELLLKKGVIKPSLTQEALFNKIILPNLENFVQQKKGDSYRAMKEYLDDESKYPAEIQEVINYINEHLTPKDVERHKYGEVFTPLTLVDEMLSKLPQTGKDNVWNKKDYKWLDPANGIGNFPIKAFIGQKTGEHTYPGLFEGLRNEIPDDKKRGKWIVENMLYMIDINVKNNRIARKLFDKLAPGAEGNIEQIDRKNGFLSEKPLVFNGKEVEKFDIIMGNPPFNKGSVRVAMVTSKTRKAKKELGIDDENSESGYWFRFGDKALDKGILKPNKFLLFIHPITWFKPDRAGAHNMMLSRQILNIRIFTDGDSKKLFGGKGEITVAYYLLKNEEISKVTNIINMNNGIETIQLNKDSIIIKQGNTIFHKIQEKCKLFGVSDSLQHRTQLSCDNSGKYKLITILEDSGQVKYVMSSIPHQDQTIPKVIVGGIPKPIVLFDKKGEFGLYKKGQRHYFIGDNLDKINDYFKTKLSTYILKFVKFEQKFIKPAYYPDVRSISITDINDDSLANYFGFTKKEREEIEKMPEPIHPTPKDFIKITCAELKKEKATEGGAPTSRFTQTRKNRKQ